MEEFKDLDSTDFFKGTRGPVPSCTCGLCTKCKTRLRVRKYYANKRGEPSIKDVVRKRLDQLKDKDLGEL